MLEKMLEAVNSSAYIRKTILLNSEHPDPDIPGLWDAVCEIVRSK